MILALEIVLLIFGLIALITGKLKLGKESIVRGAAARIVGLVWMAPLPIGFALGLALSVLDESVVALESPLLPTALELGFLVVCSLIGFSIALVARTRPKYDWPPAETNPEIVREQAMLRLTSVAETEHLQALTTPGLVKTEAPQLQSCGSDLETGRKRERRSIVHPQYKNGSDSRTVLRVIAVISAVCMVAVTAGGLFLGWSLSSRLGQPTATRATQPDPTAGHWALMPPINLRAEPPGDMPPLPPMSLPQSSMLNRSLDGPTRRLPGLIVRELDLNARLEVCYSRHYLCWNSAGDGFFYLEPAGKLHQITLSNFKELRRLDIGQQCSWLCPSAEGLLVTLHALCQVWVIDPDSLRVKRRIAVPGVFQTVSTPSLSVAFASCANIQGAEGVVYALDLKKGTVVRRYSDGRYSDWRDGNLYHAEISPDGQYLFAITGYGQIIRFTVKGTELHYEESSLRIGDNPQGIVVSPDSQYVCLPSGGGNSRNLPNHPDPGPYGLYVYAVADLKRPTLVLRGGAFRTTVGFDPRGGHIFGAVDNAQLMVFSPTGQKQSEYELMGPGNDTYHVLVHPVGNRLLVHTVRKVFYAELSDR